MRTRQLLLQSVRGPEDSETRASHEGGERVKIGESVKITMLNTVLTLHGWTESREQVTVSAVLEEACRTCEATGMVYSPAWASWNERMDAAKSEDQRRELEYEMESLGPEEIQCDACDGSGYQPTQVGKQLLVFLDHQRGNR
jgi:excinuclease UvrABC ATPase subunit